MTLSLPDFLLARIEEDEAAARAATSGPWVASGHDVERPSPLGVYLQVVGSGVDNMGNPEGGARTEDDAHYIARHDPARVLAECEAKRRIVGLHWSLLDDEGDGPALERCDCVQPTPCPTLRALALPYASHPDYRPEWRP